jgi:AcrR family transcriptional regulator
VAARLQPEQRRAQILQAAVAEISEHGFARTTTRNVAARAGVTHGLLHHYFPDLHTLLAQAFEVVAMEEMAEVEALLAANLDPLAQLRELTEPYGPGGGQDAYRFWLEAWAEAPHSPELRDITAGLSKSWMELVTSVIERGNESGVFHCAEPQHTAWMIMALCDAYAMHSQAGPAVDLREMALTARRVAEREVGLAPGALDAL